MFALAFKAGTSMWSNIIAKETGGPYSHVECWISGPIISAFCYSSREGSGTGFRTIDLTDKLWTIVRFDNNDIEDLKIQYFCKGSAGREYDYLCLLGIETGDGAHNDSFRVCSEECLNVMQQCLGIFMDEKSWLVSPNKLYELVTKNTILQKK